jgi:hypothetical protein
VWRLVEMPFGQKDCVDPARMRSMAHVDGILEHMMVWEASTASSLLRPLYCKVQTIASATGRKYFRPITTLCVNVMLGFRCQFLPPFSFGSHSRSSALAFLGVRTRSTACAPRRNLPARHCIQFIHV